jgi:hypothetical protein
MIRSLCKFGRMKKVVSGKESHVLILRKSVADYRFPQIPAPADG